MKHPHAACRFSARVSVAALALWVLAAAGGEPADRTGAGSSSDSVERPGDSGTASMPPPVDPAAPPDPSDTVLGFEDASTWTVRGGSAAGTEVRTQGSSALELRDLDEETELESGPVTSSAALLAGYADAGSSLALDVLVPRGRSNAADEDHDGKGEDADGDHDGWRPDGRGHEEGDASLVPGVQANDADEAADEKGENGDGPDWRQEGRGHKGRGPSIELLASSASRGLYRKSLGRVFLGGVRRGIYTTVRFAIPRKALEKLNGASFDDVVFVIRLRSEPRGGTWALDNLRVRSPGAPLPEAGRSANLLAVLSYSPPSSVPGEASFPVGLVQIPRDLHVKSGSAGRGSARLELGFGPKVFTTCIFRAKHGIGYRLLFCSGGLRAGDLVAADHARLTLAHGYPGAGPTKVLAQLAVNPVGDTAGAGVIPPMPTFWGATPEEASEIAIRYFDGLNRAPKTEERFITAPVPDFALRHGEGLPHDNLTGPAPPLDPPFDMEGHLNEGGNWDGYWRLAGSLVADNTANRYKTHLDAGLGVHAVVWGEDVDVATVQTIVDTDYGQLDNGLAGSNATGGLHLYLFGIEVADRPFTSGSSVSFDLTHTAPFDLPPVNIWIFSVTIGVRGEVSAKGSAAISPAGLTVLFTPKASVAAHLEGGVNIIIASGSVSADIDLIAVDTPFRALAGWGVSTDPAVCAATLGLGLDGDLHLTSLGGKIKLNATFGICPFCDHESYTIYDWEGLDVGTVPLFHVSASGQLFPLPRSLCLSPLQVKIEWPPQGSILVAGIPYALHGRATPTPTAANPFPQDADCSALHWSTDQPTDAQLALGCEPLFVFDPARLGARTISLHAEDVFGQTGDATPVGVTIAAPAPGLQAYITAPSPALLAVGGNKSPTVPIHLVGAATGASAAATFTWTAKLAPNGTPVAIGSGPEIDWAPGFLNSEGTWTFDITLTVTDGADSASATVQAVYFVLL